MIQIDDESFLLDNKLNIIWNRKTGPLKNVLTVFSLYDGICALAFEVRKEEITRIVESNGNPPTMALLEPNKNIIHNYFIWFSTSIISYLKLVCLIGLVDDNRWNIDDLATKGNKNIYRKECRLFVNNLIPDIIKWRNKIGAHLALTDPYPEDNLTTLLNSAVANFSYRKPFYYVNDYAVRQGGSDDENSDIPSWSLTQEFGKLRNRFFPNCQIPSLISAFDEIYKSPPEEDLSKVNSIISNAFSNTNKIDDKISMKMLYKGNKLYGKNKFNESISEYKKSVFSNKLNAAAWNNMAAACENLNFPWKCRRILEMLIEKNNVNEDTCYLLGQILLNKFNEPDAALKWFSRVGPTHRMYDQAFKQKKDFIEALVEDKSNYS